MSNIIKFVKYHQLNINLVDAYETSKYSLEIKSRNNFSFDSTIEVNQRNYYEIYASPLLKSMFFMLGSFGLVELKYDKPKAEGKIKKRDCEYISKWDGLKQVKLTSLGKYIFGMQKEYKIKKVKLQTNNIKFDEIKPFIYINKDDSIVKAKLDGYCEQISDEKLQLSAKRLFLDCKKYKDVENKIKRFYEMFDNLPKVVDDFFTQIKQNANLLKKEPSLITLKLEKNQKLLNFFMQNQKLNQMIIKASGYRILIKKDDIPKISKLLKENGFFVEF